MSRLISDILAAPEPHFSRTIRQWERISGSLSHDVRLSEEIKNRRRRLVHALGLDAADTTAKELYFVLRQRALADNTKITELLGINDQDTPRVMLKKIVSFIDALDIPRDVWVIKQPYIKQTLKKNPPRKLLKVLGARSLDSVLKRTNANEIIALAGEVEKSDWLDKIHNLYKGLTPGDFQSAKSSVVILSEKNQEKTQTGGYRTSQLVRPIYETGTVLVRIPAKRFNGDSLTITLAVLETMNGLRSYSAYFRLVSTKKDFGKRVAEAIHTGLPGASVEDDSMGWTVLQKHLAKNKERFKRVEHPHLHYDDVVTPEPLELIAAILPDFTLWLDNDFVVHDEKNGFVSCHIGDVMINVSNNTVYENSRGDYARMRVWEELCSRYLEHENIEDNALRKL